MNCSKCNVGEIQRTCWVNDGLSITTAYGCNKCDHGWVERSTSQVNKSSKIDELISKLKKLRVLRVTCEESGDGKFRVHLVEKEWVEIEELLEQIN